MSINSQKGVSLVEIILAMGLSAVIIPALFYGFVTVRDGRYREENRLEASVLLKDLNQQLLSARDSGWNALPVGSTAHYKTALAGNNYVIQTGEETLGDFKRYAIFSDVYRDSASGNIVSSGGVLDKSTKKVDSFITWGSGGPTNTISTSSYLSRYLQNAFWTLDTQAEFDTGTYANTQSTADGKVVLAKQPATGSWDAPTKPAFVNTSGNNNGMAVTINGNYAYLTHTGTPDLSIINITSPEAPTIEGSLNNNNSVYDVAVSGNYAYLATGKNSQELAIVDVSVKSAPNQVKTVNLGGKSQARAVALYGNHALVTKLGSTDTELDVVDISTPLSPVVKPGLQNGTISYYGMAVAGQTAYVASSDDSGELKIVNLSPIPNSAPTLTASVNLPSTSDGVDVAVFGDYAFVATKNNTTGAEFYVVRLSDRSIQSSYEVGADVNSVFTLDGDLVFLATSSTTSEFIVLDTSTKSATPVLKGSYNMTSQANGVFVNGAYAYVSSSADAEELVVLKGGGTSTYYTVGSYESQIFDRGTASGFNYVKAETTPATNCTITYQIAVSDNVGTFNYVGPLGTSAPTDVYTTDGAVPIVANTGRYFRVRVNFTSDGNNTPSLNLFKVNYAP